MCRIVLLARMLRARACQSVFRALLGSTLRRALLHARIVRPDLLPLSLLVSLMVVRGQDHARFALRARTTPTRLPPPSPLAQHAPLARTAPASAPRPARRAFSAPLAPTMIGLGPRRLLHARSAPQARTTPTQGPRPLPPAKLVLRGPTTTTQARRKQADARCE